MTKTELRKLYGSFVSQIKLQAKNRRIEFDLTSKMMWDLLIAQGQKCALSGIPLCFGSGRTASLDRIDSKLGYVTGNVQWVHKDVNRMKMAMDQDFFLELVHKIAAHNTPSYLKFSDVAAHQSSAIGTVIADPVIPGLIKPVVCGA